MSESLIEQLVTANRILANEGIVRGFGHVSVRSPAGDTMYISRSLSPAFVTADDVLEVTLSGEVIDDDRTTYLESVIHRSIYEARDDVDAVVHHHAAEIMPFTITDAELRPVYVHGMLIHDGVPTFDDYDEEYGFLVATEAEARRMAENLGDHSAQLLAGHGANNVGASLKEAILSTVYFVTNAKHQAAAMSIGEVTWEPGPEEAIRTQVEDVTLSEVPIDRMWTYLTRQLPDR